MNDTIIQATHIGKSYTIRHQEQYYTLRDRLVEMATFPVRAIKRTTKTKKEIFSALDDINFQVQEGEIVGIIGRNGAGKSTLLKILSQITPPTAGKIHLRGRVASLLEVGTGFHPELTGRENIFLNGAILGMKQKEIRQKFDEIVAFSEIEKFLDTPLKRYSSGMNVRLAFAVAAHLEPEILLVDEVLAVGDVAFQKKCLGKMSAVIKGGGRTILFVSHNMSAIQTLCTRAMLLEKGKIKNDGQVESVIQEYLNLNKTAGSGTGPFPTDIAGFIIKKIALLKQPSFNDPLRFQMDINTNVLKKDVTVEFHLINSQMNRIATGKTTLEIIRTGQSSTIFTIEKPQLPPGSYSIDVSIHTFNTGFFYQQQILFFDINPGELNDPFVIARKDTLGSYPEMHYEIVSTS